MMVSLAIVRLMLAAILGLAAVGKLLDLGGTRDAVAGFGVPHGLARSSALLLPASELSIALGLLWKPSTRLAGTAAVVLFATFTAALFRALVSGRAAECHCFGRLHSAPASRRTLARAAALLGAALAVALLGPGVPLGEFADQPTGTGGLVVSLATALGVSLLSLAMLARSVRSDRTQPPPQPLPIGTPAASSRLGSDRGSVDLEQLLGQGRPSVLVFMSANCAQCRAYLPELAARQTRVAGRASVIAIAWGDPEINAAHAAEHNFDGMLYAEGDPTLLQQYGIRLTPCGLVIDEHGRVASAPLEGPAAISAMLNLLAPEPAVAEAAAMAHTAH